MLSVNFDTIKLKLTTCGNMVSKGEDQEVNIDMEKSEGSVLLEGE